MAHSTQLSFQPEMYSGQDFPRKADTTNQIQSSASAGSKQLSKWSSPSLRTSGNQTNKSPKLAFAAAIVAASLQFFALPGLTAEHQENLTQQGSANNTGTVYNQDNLNELLWEMRKSNEWRKPEVIGVGLTLFGIILSIWQLKLILVGIPKLEEELMEVTKENKRIKTKTDGIVNALIEDNQRRIDELEKLKNI